MRGAWKRNGFAVQRFQITGTGTRNNPLRQQLNKPYSGKELFVRFRLRYDAGSIDLPNKDDRNGEFFVLWLDDAEGNESSSHASNVPNVGLHVDNQQNRFMVRFHSSSQQFAGNLEGDQDFLIVARLSKADGNPESAFDQLSLWINPKVENLANPQAVTNNSKSISSVRWIGFSTGLKTEVDDRIDVWDIEVADNWREILGLPPSISLPSTSPAFTKKTIEFTKHIYPILKARCFECHSGKDAEQVRLDVIDEVLNATTPRNADQSKLYKLAASGKMPPDGPPLNKQELASLKTWINEGLDWDEKLLPTPLPLTKHWAFQPIRRPTIPNTQRKNWIRTPIDAFIARKHAQHGLTPAASANSETLDRRMSLDVTGLPPSETGITNPSKSIDKLLNHSGYGERWGRHWLDVARWAESNGHQHNRHRAFAWRYRDWVVDALNNDMPFDQFVRAQIAGDELAPYKVENIIATGFLAAARYSGNELDKAIQRNDILVDIVNTTASAFLGLTFECAQCHTHKFDPLSIRDYYRFQAFFTNGQPQNIVIAQDRAEINELIKQRWQIFDSVYARLYQIKKRQGIANPVIIPKAVIGGMRTKERTAYKVIEEKINKLPQTWSYYSPSSAVEQLAVAPHDMRFPLPYHPQSLASLRTMLLIRGDIKTPGPEVSAGWPAVFGATPDLNDKPRSALASWLFDPKNPLTARVWVNRIWQWHFGRGLVETSGDFGAQGTKPSHPDLLDFLASELIEHGWSTKHIHRLILNSATYQQSHSYSEQNAKIDPENKWLWRWKPRRLEAEAIRDSLLAISGLLDVTRGGPSTANLASRRSIYLRQQRDNLPHQQVLFDSASGNLSCSRRRISTTTMQPLWLMNSNFAQDCATALAKRTKSAKEAFKLCFGRDAEANELERMLKHEKEHGLQSVCLGLLNSSEFLYIP